jgi:hypothetical protein
MLWETERHGARRKQRRFPKSRQSATADRQDGVPESQPDQQDRREHEPILRLGTVVDVEGLHPKNERSDETDRHRDPRPSAPGQPQHEPQHCADEHDERHRRPLALDDSGEALAVVGLRRRSRLLDTPGRELVAREFDRRAFARDGS